jgi:hypothetical protein
LDTGKEFILETLERIKETEAIRRDESPISRSVLNTKNVEFLIEKGFDVNQKNYFGKTPIYYAIEYNQHDTVKLLIKAGANVNDTYDDGKGIWCSDIEHWKRTPLMHAAQHADVAMLRILIDSRRYRIVLCRKEWQ